MLVESGANVDIRDNHWGSTALMFAAENDNVEVVEFLVISGAKINETNDTGMTALMFAAMKGHINPTKYLIALGADIELQDENGDTALLFASKGGFPSVCNALQDAGGRSIVEDKIRKYQVTNH